MLLPVEPFSYELPPSRIAQRPVYPYDAAKLMVLDRQKGTIADHRFSSFVRWVRAGDLVIFNNSRVIPARIFGKTRGGGTQVELLLLKEKTAASWLALGRPLKKLPEGTVIEFPAGLAAKVVSRVGEIEIEIALSVEGGRSILEVLAEIGKMPVPPYIRGGLSDETDRADYQSVFAKVDGSVAAPTASLHFTPALNSSLKDAGAIIKEVTLHVGAASFLPLWREGQSTQLSLPGPERCVFSSQLKDEILKARAESRRVFAVGTTVVRAIETFMLNSDLNDGDLFETSLFISPGFEFKAVDALVTNFHQPATTHLLLVEAFLGRDLLQRAYQHALDSDYRFLSYGDGMVILP